MDLYTENGKYKTKLIKERRELEEAIESIEFSMTQPGFNLLKEEDRNLLEKQVEQMEKVLYLVNTRLALFD